MIKKIFFAIFILILNTTNIYANINGQKGLEENYEIPKYKAFVLGDQKGHIFYSENMKEKMPLASVTKIMTLLLTFDALHNGTISLDDKVEVDKEMATMGGSKIWMKEGSFISVEDLIKATAIHSANNAAYGLAKLVGGNIDNFVMMMNKKAAILGFGDEIKYNTPSGLPPSMTGREMDIGSALGVYKLSLAALKYKDYIDIASKKETRLSYSKKYKIHNRNKLLGKEGIYGIKTGHLDDWYNIAVASKNKLNSICVVLGSPTAENRDDKILQGITEFNENYRDIKLLDKNIPVSEIKLGNSKLSIDIYVDKNFNYVMKNSDKIKFYIYRDSKLEGPIRSGDIVGRYELKINDRLVNAGNLLTK